MSKPEYQDTTGHGATCLPRHSHQICTHSSPQHTMHGHICNMGDELIVTPEGGRRKDSWIPKDQLRFP